MDQQPTSLHERSEERRALRERLASGASVLMLAPRRIGKTWLLGRLGDDMIHEGWTCIRLDVEGMRNEEQFLRALCREIEQNQDLSTRLFAHVKQRLRKVSNDCGKDGLAAALGQIDPRDFLETLIDGLAAEGGKVLILIDEIALFVLELVRADPDAARALLYHLRKLQQGYPTVRWFLTGSVGLDVVARKHGLSGALLDYDVIPLDPFPSEAARSYIEALSRALHGGQAMSFEPTAFETLATELGWLSPYYLRQIILSLRPTGSPDAQGRPQASAPDIERAFAKLLTPVHRLHFTPWEEHIVKNFDKTESARLAAILDILCETMEGESETALLTRLGASETGSLSQRDLRDMLLILTTDGYIRRNEERWQFLSGLLRRYWLEYKKN